MRDRFVAVRLALVFAVASMMMNGRANAATQPDHWVGTWAASPLGQENSPTGPGTSDMTLREIVHVSRGGERIRVEFTNEFGTDPLTIGAAHIALSAGGSEIRLGSANALTFNGRNSITIPVGAMVVSDPADLKLPALSDLAISIFIPAQPLSRITQHTFADQTNYITTGNVVGEKTLPTPEKFAQWRFVKGVDVLASANDAAIVTLGDSITDGAYATENGNARWPDVLARRLQADKKTAGLGVLNQGIGGNRVLREGYGPSAEARFDRDVLSQAGVKYLVIMEGINDVGHATSPIDPRDPVTADEMIAGLAQLVARAHLHGLKVSGATLTPYVGAKYQSDAGEKIRVAVNEWIRSNKSLDGLIDFDKVTRDPANPSMFLPVMDHGDHLHPGDAGYKAMGEAVDLELFGGK
jgi:lysophospholipase L1-like esterase